MIEGQDGMIEEQQGTKHPFYRGFLWGMIVMLAISTAVVLGTRFYGWPMDGADDVLSRRTQDKIHKITELIDEFFIEDVSSETLENGLFSGLLAGLDDPYSQYFTAESFRALTETTSGQYYGIGAVLTQDPRTMEVKILRAYPGSPAEEAGLKSGDMILQVGDIESTSMELSQLIQHIRGEEGTSVLLQIDREEEGGPLEIEVTRRRIEVPTVEYQMLEGMVGFIQISEFSEVTHEQFYHALDDLLEQGMQAFIVDVRNNPGGLITSVTDILNDFLPEGLLVYTEDKHGNRTEFNSSGEHYVDLPMAVLINGYSASASEIFAGAIRDFHFGTLIGTTTFGKGIVQRIIPLSDGSAVKITTATYFTPSGDNIHNVGIAPDIELEFEYSDKEDTAYNPMHDNQVIKALEILR